MTEADDDFGEREPPSRYAKAFIPLPGSTPVALVDLERGRCKWPIGDGPILMCGLPAPDGRYCTTHAKMAKDKVPA